MTVKEKIELLIKMGWSMNKITHITMVSRSALDKYVNEGLGAYKTSTESKINRALNEYFTEQFFYTQAKKNK